MPDTILRGEGVGKRYGSGARELVVFSGLNLGVRARERLAIVGPSGAGKSTLLHILGCLDRPSEGRIHVGPREVSGLPDEELAELRNRMFGFVWQMNTLMPEFTALENVALPLWIRGSGAKEAERAALDGLRETGLEPRAHHRPGEMSGGEQQRVALARALVTRPEILLADEPTGNLDEATGERVMNLLEEVHERHNLTMVLVTHNPVFARRCHRVLELEAGVLRPSRGSAGSPDEESSRG